MGCGSQFLGRWSRNLTFRRLHLGFWIWGALERSIGIPIFGRMWGDYETFRNGPQFPSLYTLHFATLGLEQSVQNTKALPCLAAYDAVINSIGINLCLNGHSTR
jgi:hypothetical protein